MHCEFAIIGAGINGLLTALELSRISDRVVVLESTSSRQSCSWAGGGILSPLLPWTEHEHNYALCELGQSLYPELCGSLINETGIDPEFQPCGMLIMECDDAASGLDWCHSHKVPAEPVNGKDRATFYGLRFSSDRESIWLPQVAHVRNPRLLRALHARLKNLGVDLFEQTPVRQLVTGQGYIECQTDGENIQAESVILCTGTWLNDLLPEQSRLEMNPARGQMLCLKNHDPGIRQVVLRNGCYVIPRRDNVLLIGSTVETAGFDHGITDQAREELLNAAREFLPGLNGYTDFQQWSGLRPDPGRGYPYIGKIPGMDRLYVNAGHFRTGLLTAPASARLMRELITGTETSLDTGVYSPG